MIPYGHQTISREDVQAVAAVLRSGSLTQGLVVPVFEKGVANYCEAEHTIAVNSVTCALHSARLAFFVGQKEVIWTAPITYAESANCALNHGQTIDFVDIDPPEAISLQMYPGLTEADQDRIVAAIREAISV